MWIDSWHTPDKYMLFESAMTTEEVFSVKGSYPAPPDPDWGWWIDIEPEDKDTFRMVMHNVSPEGRASLAVEARYTRKR